MNNIPAARLNVPMEQVRLAAGAHHRIQGTKDGAEAARRLLSGPPPAGLITVVALIGVGRTADGCAVALLTPQDPRINGLPDILRFLGGDTCWPAEVWGELLPAEVAKVPRDQGVWLLPFGVAADPGVRIERVIVDLDQVADGGQQRVPRSDPRSHG